MTNHEVSAWAPANISLIFKVHPDSDPQKMGSYGLGFTIDQGVTVTVSKSDKTEVLFNDKLINFPTVEQVLKKILRFTQDDNENVQDDNFVKVSITSSLPLGCGFGLSGASALATSYAINELFGLGKTKLELAKIAHSAEVMNSTGLGDVVNQYFGGFLLKTKPSSEFVVEKVPLINIPVYCKVFTSLETSSVLLDKHKINIIEHEASHSLHYVQNMMQDGNIHISQLLRVARKFAEASHLIASKDVSDSLEEIDALGGHGTMMLLGNAVVSDIAFPGSIQYMITSVGAHVI